MILFKTKRLFLFPLLFLTSFLNAQITWSEDVAPIIYQKCSHCHHQGAIAPFSLMSYGDVTTFASPISHVLTEGIMPPWPPDPNYKHFADEFYLTNSEVQLIQGWLNSGMQPGDLTQAPDPPQFLPGGSLLDTIHHTVSFGAYTLQTNTDEYRYFAVKNPFNQTVYINKVEVIPGLKDIVHHGDLYYDVSGQSLLADEADSIPGFNGNPNLSKYINAWSPGANPARYPDGWGVALPPNADFVMELHYGPGGYGEVDSTIMNLQFLSQPMATRSVRVGWLLSHYAPSLLDGPLVIPADSITFFHQESAPMSQDFSFIAVAPHMHLIGDTYKVWAVTPTNDTIRIIDIPKWDFHWQRYYYFPNIIKLPQGTVIHSRASFDNTSSNHDQPNDPPITIERGPNTDDEMLLCYFMYAPYQPGDENIVMGDTIPDDTPLVSSVNKPLPHLEFDVFPNPASDRTFLQGTLHKPDNVVFEVFNIKGERMVTQLLSWPSGEFNHEINIKDYPTGIYYIKSKGRYFKNVSSFIKH